MLSSGGGDGLEVLVGERDILTSRIGPAWFYRGMSWWAFLGAELFDLQTFTGAKVEIGLRENRRPWFVQKRLAQQCSSTI